MLSALKRFFFQILALVVAVAFLTFAMVNRETITLNLSPLPYIVEIRLFMLVGILILSGILIGWVAASFESRRRYLLKKTTKQRVTALENEVQALRTRSHLPDHSPAHHNHPHS